MDGMKEQVVEEVKDAETNQEGSYSYMILVPDFPALNEESLVALNEGVERVQSLLDSGEKVDINDLFKTLANSVGLNRIEFLRYIIETLLQKQQNKENAYPYFRCLYTTRFEKGGKGRLEGVYPRWNEKLEFIFTLYDLTKDLIDKTERAKSASQKNKEARKNFSDAKKQFNSFIGTHITEIVEQQNQILYSYDYDSLLRLKTCDTIKTSKAVGVDLFRKSLDERINVIKPKQSEDTKRTLKESSPKAKKVDSKPEEPIKIDEEQKEPVVVSAIETVKEIVEKAIIVEPPKVTRIEDREVSNDGDRISIILELSLTGDFERIRNYLDSIAYEQGSDALSRIIKATLNLSPDDNTLFEQFARYIAFASTESDSNAFDTFRFISQLMKGQLDRKTQEFILIVFDYMSKYGQKGCKEARMFKRQLDQSEVVYQKRICNSLSKPLGKIEQTMSNLRNQDKPVKEVMGILMDQVAGIHYALEECGVEPVGAVNKWIEQAPVAFEAGKHIFDSSVTPDATKPVTLRTIGLKARDGRDSDGIIKSIVRPVEKGDNEL